MAKVLQHRRDTTANLSSVSGAIGEFFMDTTKNTLVVMDGSTNGGHPLATESYVDTSINNLIGGAPGALDTLNELAAAINDDANAYTTLSNSIAAKQDTLVSGTSIKTVNGTSLLGSGDITISGYTNSDVDTHLNTSSATSNYVLSWNGSDYAWVAQGSGGSASTGDYTFANNVISLPEYTNAELNLVGNQTRNVPIYLQFYSDTGSGAGYSLPATGVFEVGLQEFTWTGNGQDVVLILQTDASQTLIDSINNWQAGDTFDIVYLDSSTGPSPYDLIKTTVTLASDAVLRSGTNTVWDFTVLEDEPTNMSATAVAIDNYPYKTNAAYNLKANGQFIAQEAIIGETFIANDIITPLVLDSYGLVDSSATGTLTVNGNLEVTGNIVLAGNISPYTETFGSFSAEANKKYIIRSDQSNLSATITVTLPSATASIGDVIEFFVSPDNNQAPVEFDGGSGGFVNGTRYFRPTSSYFKFEIIRTTALTNPNLAQWRVVQSPSASVNGNYQG